MARRQSASPSQLRILYKFMFGDIFMNSLTSENEKLEVPPKTNASGYKCTSCLFLAFYLPTNQPTSLPQICCKLHKYIHKVISLPTASFLNLPLFYYVQKECSSSYSESVKESFQPPYIPNMQHNAPHNIHHISHPFTISAISCSVLFL